MQKFQSFFPQSFTWIYKNLLHINEDFPEEIFPRYLTANDFGYLREVSVVELQIESKNFEIKLLKTRDSTLNLSKTQNLLDSKEKLNEVRDKIKAFKRESLFIQEIDSKSLELRKMSELQGGLPQENDDFFSKNSGFFGESSVLPSENVKNMIFQRSRSKKEMKTQIESIENKRKSQLQAERFFEEKQKLLQTLKENKMQELCKEFSPQNIDEKSLERLKKRAYALFGVKEGEKFLEENYKENASIRSENRILNQNIKGHEFLERKMEKMKKVRLDHQSRQRINYQFNPIYNKFPQLMNENNANNSSFFVQNK